MTLRKKICSATIFLCIIAHVLLGYLVNRFTGSNEGYYYGFLLYILVCIYFTHKLPCRQLLQYKQL